MRDTQAQHDSIWKVTMFVLAVIWIFSFAAHSDEQERLGKQYPSRCVKKYGPTAQTVEVGAFAHCKIPVSRDEKNWKPRLKKLEIKWRSLLSDSRMSQEEKEETTRKLKAELERETKELNVHCPHDLTIEASYQLAELYCRSPEFRLSESCSATLTPDKDGLHKPRGKLIKTSSSSGHGEHCKPI